VSEAIDKHVSDHGTTEDGYLFRGRRHKHVSRRTYQGDFERAAAKAGLPPEFIPHSLRHCYASTALACGIPITEVSRWLGHKSIEVTPPDLRPPGARLLGPRPHRPRRCPPRWTAPPAATGNPALTPACSRSAWPISPPLSFIAEMRSRLHEEDHGEAGAGV
jgi:hypothetical protein